MVRECIMNGRCNKCLYFSQKTRRKGSIWATQVYVEGKDWLRSYGSRRANGQAFVNTVMFRVS